MKFYQLKTNVILIICKPAKFFGLSTRIKIWHPIFIRPAGCINIEFWSLHFNKKADYRDDYDLHR